LSSVYGTYMIGALRREAFEAKQLGQYRLGRLIGSGGMGDVYLAEHQMMKRPVAIKLIRPGRQTDPQALARFEREVRATAKLSHWNTIEIFDYGRSEDGTFYYVMEYLPGVTLEDLVAREGPLSIPRALRVTQQIASALGEAHSVGLTHRDIKPGNVMLCERGGLRDVAKLLDFGLVVNSASGSADAKLTQAGMVIGSPAYMSPEQCEGELQPAPASDIYSVGALLYFLLTGRSPFEGRAPLQMMMAHVGEVPKSAASLRTDVPSGVDAIVMRCLAKNPAERFASASKLEAALVKQLAELSV
jgi:serine/threonine-protein kinase